MAVTWSLHGRDMTSCTSRLLFRVPGGADAGDHRYMRYTRYIHHIRYICYRRG